MRTIWHLRRLLHRPLAGSARDGWRHSKSMIEVIKIERRRSDGKNGEIMCSSMLQRRSEERFAVQLSQVSHRTKNTAAVGSKGEQRDTKREGETRSMATRWSWCPVLKTFSRKLFHWPNNFEQENESSVQAIFAWGRCTNYIYAQLCKEKKRRRIRCKAIGSCWKETENRGECKETADVVVSVLPSRLLYYTNRYREMVAIRSLSCHAWIFRQPPFRDVSSNHR